MVLKSVLPLSPVTPAAEQGNKAAAARASRRAHDPSCERSSGISFAYRLACREVAVSAPLAARQAGFGFLKRIARHAPSESGELAGKVCKVCDGWAARETGLLQMSRGRLGLSARYSSAGP
jgi:hypothetical protein